MLVTSSFLEYFHKDRDRFEESLFMYLRTVSHSEDISSKQLRCYLCGFCAEVLIYLTINIAFTINNPQRLSQVPVWAEVNWHIFPKSHLISSNLLRSRIYYKGLKRREGSGKKADPRTPRMKANIHCFTEKPIKWFGTGQGERGLTLFSQWFPWNKPAAISLPWELTQADGLRSWMEVQLQQEERAKETLCTISQLHRSLQPFQSMGKV